MPHIHTEPGQHDHTVTLYVIRVDGDEPEVLLHLHRKLGRLLPVGGHIELDETPWQAAAHELREESGYALEELKILQPKNRIKNLTNAVIHPVPVVYNTHTITTDHLHSDTAYAFVATSDPSAEVNAGESLDLRWLAATELRKLTDTEIFPSTRTVYEFILKTILKEWVEVPTGDFQL